MGADFSRRQRGGVGPEGTIQRKVFHRTGTRPPQEPGEPVMLRVRFQAIRTERTQASNKDISSMLSIEVLRTEDSWIQKTPDICGGDACIRNTRLPVWSLVV